jgi:hypothetical protein
VRRRRAERVPSPERHPPTRAVDSDDFTRTFRRPNSWASRRATGLSTAVVSMFDDVIAMILRRCSKGSLAIRRFP